ncbi:MAG: dihydrodipicolinate synthase family protein [Acidimicrobiales bacterium]|nr:dihydrodipicolinate synthase family protein [Acidimicrobiales bacterium]
MGIAAGYGISVRRCLLGVVHGEVRKMREKREPLLPNGVVAPILTPFENDLAVSHDRLVAHAHQLLEEGCVGLAVFGTTGEALSVGVRERKDAVEALVTGGINPACLVVGTGMTDLPSTVHLTRHAMELGCRACMVLPPFYFKDPAAEGLFRHFAGLIDGIGDDRLQIMLYHIPQVAGVGLPVSLVARLHTEFPEVIVAIKDSSGDWDNTRALFDIDGLTVYPGAELPLMEALDLGGPGCITATANVNAGPLAEVIALHASGNRDAAKTIMNRVRVFRLLLQEYQAVPIQKRLLALRLGDPIWATVRPPFLEADELTGTRLEERIAAL